MRVNIRDRTERQNLQRERKVHILTSLTCLHRRDFTNSCTKLVVVLLYISLLFKSTKTMPMLQNKLRVCTEKHVLSTFITRSKLNVVGV